jgi:hypothetical protein
MLTNDAMRQPSTLSQTGGSATIYGYGNISLPVNVVSETNHGPAGELLTVSPSVGSKRLDGLPGVTLNWTKVFSGVITRE